MNNKALVVIDLQNDITFEKEINNMKDKYYDQAIACVKDRVLPAQLELYQSCDGDFDADPKLDKCKRVQ